MVPPSRKLPSQKSRLSDGMRSIASSSRDDMVRLTPKMLEEFEYSEVVGERYVWKYLPDENFRTTYDRPGVTAFDINRAVLSHLARVIEAFEIVSIWRGRDLVDSAVACLNAERLVSAATLSRSLIELTVTYGHAANLLRASFENLSWDKIRTHLFRLEERDEKGRRIGIESFIERL